MGVGNSNVIPGLLEGMSPHQQQALQRMASQQGLLQLAAGLLDPRGTQGNFGAALNKGVQQGLGAFNTTLNQAAQINAQNQTLQTARDRNEIAREQNQITQEHYQKPDRVRQLPSGAYVEEFLDGNGNVINQRFAAGPPSTGGIGGLAGLLDGGLGGGAAQPSPADLAERARQMSQQQGGGTKAPPPAPEPEAPKKPWYGTGTAPIGYETKQRPAAGEPEPLYGRKKQEFVGVKPIMETPTDQEDSGGLFSGAKADLNRKKAEMFLRDGDKESMRRLLSNPKVQLPEELKRRMRAALKGK